MFLSKSRVSKIVALIILSTSLISPIRTRTAHDNATNSSETNNTSIDMAEVAAVAKTALKTGWTAVRLIGIAGCFKLAHMHKEEIFDTMGMHVRTYAEYTPFGTYLAAAGLIAHNIYKSYEASIKTYAQEFFEEQEELLEEEQDVQ